METATPQLGATAPATRARRPTLGEVPATVPAGTTAAVLVAAVVAVGVGLRFWAESRLWLDEALTVNLARLPLSQLPEALRHDGSPPLYYVLLHGWMALVGSGDLAVRALSGLFGVVSLPLAWLAGRRLGGSRVAWAALLLMASSPFAVRYATETRMYALVVLLTLVGYLALANALARPSAPRLVAVALTVAALLLTHYWSAYLVAAVAAALAWRVRGGGADRAPARRCLVAMGAGTLLFVPWLPVLAFQAANTGTPWGRRPTSGAVPATITELAGGSSDAGLFLSLLFTVLLVLACFGRPLDGRRVELDLSGRGPALTLAFVTFATLALAVAASRLAGTAFTSRYASVVLAPFLLVVALGTAVFADQRVRTGVLAVAVALGLLGSAANVGAQRTQAPQVARALTRWGSAGDVVAYCPDQLGPAVSRILPAGFEQLTFPEAGSPFRVDWVDYAKRNRGGDPEAFAQLLLERAGAHREIFVVWAPGYRGLGRRCEQLLRELGEQRRQVIRVRRSRSAFETMRVMHYVAR